MAVSNKPVDKNKLVGQNYSTPEIRTKVTGRSRYAEDFRAQGMLHCRLLLSPYAHARVLSIDASAALAMPGVKAILTADEVPGPKDQVNDAGQTIRANPRSEKALTNEPMYQGEPVLAVAATDELTAAEAIEKIKIRWEPLPFSVDPVATLLPGAMTARVEGNVWVRPTPVAGQPPGVPEVQDLKWTQAEVDEYHAGRLPMGKTPIPSGSTATSRPGSRKRTSFSTKRSSRRIPATSASRRAPRWRTGRTGSSTSICRRRARADGHVRRALVGSAAGKRRAHRRVLRRRVRREGNGNGDRHYSRPALEENRDARADAHEPRGRARGWRCASGLSTAA
jgi:hypothetical protein